MQGSCPELIHKVNADVHSFGLQILNALKSEFEELPNLISIFEDEIDVCFFLLDELLKKPIDEFFIIQIN